MCHAWRQATLEPQLWSTVKLVSSTAPGRQLGQAVTPRLAALAKGLAVPARVSQASGLAPLLAPCGWLALCLQVLPSEDDEPGAESFLSWLLPRAAGVESLLIDIDEAAVGAGHIS